jgi:ankyrin repeat protein
VSSAQPLCNAAANGKLDAVRLLLWELGADVNQLLNDCSALCAAAQMGHEHVVWCLVKEFGSDVHLLNHGFTALYVAAEAGHEQIVRCLLGECGANVNQVGEGGRTALYAAARKGLMNVVRCLVKDFGADVNIAASEGRTPLMVAAECKHTEVVVWLTKHGADSQALHEQWGTAANFSKLAEAPAEQTAYLEARTHCAKPGCSGAGLKKCALCLIIFYCGKECQVAHWPAHKAECKRSARLAAGQSK